MGNLAGQYLAWEVAEGGTNDQFHPTVTSQAPEIVREPTLVVEAVEAVQMDFVILDTSLQNQDTSMEDAYPEVPTELSVPLDLFGASPDPESGSFEEEEQPDEDEMMSAEIPPEESEHEDPTAVEVDLETTPTKRKYNKKKKAVCEILAIDDKPIQILDNQVYAGLPDTFFKESPRRSGRTALKRPSTPPPAEQQPPEKRRRNSTGVTVKTEGTVTAPYSEPRKVTGKSPLSNYGATTTRETPSSKAKHKVTKKLF